MSGNKQTYNDAMRKAHNAAWDRQWATAIREYARALSEFPDDAAAHSGLAASLEAAGQLEPALHEYQVTGKLQPHDPAPLAHTAGLLERLGRRSEAAALYLQLAEMYAGLRQMNRAVEAWRRAASLEPERTETHDKLVAAYKEAGHSTAAANELTALARVYQRRGNTARARACLDEALALDPENAPARVVLDELTGRGARRAPAAGGPVEQARRSALSRLAQSVLEETPRWVRPPTTPQPAPRDLEAELAKAIDAQTQGRTAEAIEAYRQILESGGARTEVQFNLALLYQQSDRYGDAITLLQQTAGDENFALASRLALGECYRAQGKVESALDQFIQAVQIVDLATVARAQADDVIRAYESLAESYRAQGAEARAQEFMETLLGFLNHRGWQDKAREVQRHVEAMAAAGTPLSFAEVLQVPNSQRVIESLALSERHLAAGRLLAAGDEAYHAIELAPEYLPAHVRLAEICERAGRTPEAREKYGVLAETAAVRGDTLKAIAFYRHALQLAPDDVTQRAKLIDLLMRNDRLAEALEEFMRLGAALEQAGQPQKAIDKYLEALRLAQRAGVVTPVVTELRTHLADCYSAAGDWPDALALYQQLQQAAPDDERLRFQLADLYLKLGDRTRGEHEVEVLLQQYAGAPPKQRAVLEALVRRGRDDLWLNFRLVETLVECVERESAIALLDELGERLLNAGERADAMAVIQRIIALAPPQVDDYRRLLEELKMSGQQT